MKTGTLKIAGAAAVGMAFAAAAAVPASAAVADGLLPGQGLPNLASENSGLPNAQQAVGDTVSTVGTAADLTPADAHRALPLPAGSPLDALPLHALPTDQLLSTVTGAAGKLQAVPVNAPARGETRALPLPGGDGPVTGAVKTTTDTVGKVTHGAASKDTGSPLGGLPLGGLPIGG